MKDKIKKHPHPPGTKAWEMDALRLAASFAPPVYPCQKCDVPVLKGYCCGSCGTSNPYDPKLKIENETKAL